MRLVEQSNLLFEQNMQLEEDKKKMDEEHSRVQARMTSLKSAMKKLEFLLMASGVVLCGFIVGTLMKWLHFVDAFCVSIGSSDSRGLSL